MSEEAQQADQETSEQEHLKAVEEAAKSFLGSPPEDAEKQNSEEEKKSEDETPADILEQAEKKSEESKADKIAKLLQRDAERVKDKISTKPADKEPEEKKDNAERLKELGISVEDLVAEYLLDSSPKKSKPEPEEKPEYVQALEKKISELEGRLGETQTSYQQELVNRNREKAERRASEYIKENSERLQLLNNTEQASSILVNLLVAKYEEDQDYYKANNTAPTFDDIADGVEEYLVEQNKRQLDWIAKQPKLRESIIGLADKLRSQSANGAESSKPKPYKTLDNDITAERFDRGEDPETEEERVALAIQRVRSARQQAQQ